MKVSNNPAKYEVPNKQYLRSILDISALHMTSTPLHQLLGRFLNLLLSFGRILLFQHFAKESRILKQSRITMKLPLQTAAFCKTTNKNGGRFI